MPLTDIKRLKMSDTVIDLVNDSESEDVIMIDDQPETSEPKEEKQSMETNEQEEEPNASVNDTDEVEFVPISQQTLAEEKKNAGNEEYKSKRYDDALRLYTEAINLSPDTAAYYGNRSACHMMRGDYRAALNDVKKAISIDEKYEKGYIRMAKCSLVLGDVVGTEQAIRKFLSFDPSNTALRDEITLLKQLRDFNEKAAACYDLKDYRTCLFHCDNAIKIAPASIQNKLLKAECLAMLHRFEEAGNIAITIMQSNSANADAIYVRGLTLYYCDNLEKGLLHFERALMLDPDHKKAKAMRQKAKQLKEKKETGNELFKTGKFRPALTTYSEALEIDPLNKDINSKLYYNRALVNSKLGNLREAITDCTKALSLNEKYMKALLQRAKLHYNMENYEEAVKDYEKALKHDRSMEIKNLLKDAKLQLKKSKRKDYYKILGVTKQASEDEIKKAYRKRALVHHPDRHANATDEEKKEQERKFKELGEAYTVLSDPVKKSRYDSGQDLEDMSGADFDPQNVYRQFFFPSDFSFGGFPASGGSGQGGNYSFHFG
ncbi:dnaJ homolog subfamily C member 7 isoform X2 [Anopheles ziemanni]|uniref:dnaJ homolog subfamily C member 7 isoform X2 n=1 Tax=Anopheles coustani TaxID=139045 RepID=UPI0026584C10|nr:dnaJ homolog subfamily C member 7 isoform X2 [Anopheles coustani]XP_058167719.1 dnaJ homolog subfamily C member 7 isoform X2 [Anopheles ziemanni]